MTVPDYTSAEDSGYLTHGILLVSLIGSFIAQQSQADEITTIDFAQLSLSAN